MNAKVILSLCVVLVLVTNSSAQTFIAGSEQDKLFTKAMAASGDERIKWLQDFEKQFPNDKSLSSIYTQLTTEFNQKNDRANVLLYGEKAIKADESNFIALLTVSRTYGLAKQNLTVAKDYAQRAVDILAKLKAESRYSEDATWKAFIDSSDASARANLAWIRTL